MPASITHRFLAFLRHCPICGQFLSPVFFTCKPCQEKLFNNMCVSQAEVNLPFPVYSLWTWGSLDHAISFLLYSLKGGGGYFFYKKLSQKCFLSSTFFKEDFVYIPAAGRGGDLDHAGLCAKAFAHTFSAPFFNILCRIKNTTQKRLSREERIKNTVIINKTKSHCPQSEWSNKNIIFIDDVLTTGGTALAAYRALGSPKFFKVLVLAYRPKIR